MKKNVNRLFVCRKYLFREMKVSGYAHYPKSCAKDPTQDCSLSLASKSKHWTKFTQSIHVLSTRLSSTLNTQPLRFFTLPSDYVSGAT